MARKHVSDPTLVNEVAQNLFLALPIFRKRLLHMDVIQREFNIPLSHVQVLSMLKDNGSMTVSEISRRLGIAKPNITPLIDRLIESEYVMRQRNDEDHRRVNITICPSGEERIAEIRVKMQELVGEWAGEFTSAELKRLNAGLQSITEILGSHLQAPEHG